MTRARELAELGSVYNGGAALSNRNYIINGNMEIAQRGTSQTAAGYGSLDRFQMSLSGATATMTQESFTIGQTDVVGSHKFLKLAVSTGNNNSGVFYHIEAQDAIALIGKKVTVTYYAKGTSPAAGLQVAMEWYDGSSSSPSSSTTVTLTSSWVKYTHTFDVPSISGLTLTNANTYLEIKWAQANADTGTGAYEVNLAQVQLEEGDTATPFEHRLFGDELLRCQRYFEKSYRYSDALGTVDIDGAVMWLANRNPGNPHYGLRFRTEKRADPTITSFNPNDGTSGEMRNLDATSDDTVTIDRIGTNGCTIRSNVNSTSLGQFMAFHYSAEAEL